MCTLKDISTVCFCAKPPEHHLSLIILTHTRYVLRADDYKRLSSSFVSAVWFIFSSWTSRSPFCLQSSFHLLSVLEQNSLFSYYNIKCAIIFKDSLDQVELMKLRLATRERNSYRGGGWCSVARGRPKLWHVFLMAKRKSDSAASSNLNILRRRFLNI